MTKTEPRFWANILPDLHNPPHAVLLHLEPQSGQSIPSYPRPPGQQQHDCAQDPGYDQAVSWCLFSYKYQLLCLAESLKVPLSRDVYGTVVLLAAHLRLFGWQRRLKKIADWFGKKHKAWQPTIRWLQTNTALRRTLLWTWPDFINHVIIKKNKQFLVNHFLLEKAQATFLHNHVIENNYLTGANIFISMCFSHILSYRG